MSELALNCLEGNTMRVNITLACTECGDRNYISTKINVTILIVLSLKNIAQEKNVQQHIVKQNKQWELPAAFLLPKFKSFKSE